MQKVVSEMLKTRYFFFIQHFGRQANGGALAPSGYATVSELKRL